MSLFSRVKNQLILKAPDITDDLINSVLKDRVLKAEYELNHYKYDMFSYLSVVTSFLVLISSISISAINEKNIEIFGIVGIILITIFLILILVVFSTTLHQKSRKTAFYVLKCYKKYKEQENINE